MYKPPTPRTRAEELPNIQSAVSRGAGLRFAAAYERIACWLASLDLESQALRAGNMAPDFLLPDDQGRLISSRDLRRKGPLIVKFLRGGWCPFCLAELSVLQDSILELDALSAELVTVTPDTGSNHRDLKRDNHISLKLLSDVDHGVGLSFGLIFSIPADIRTLLERLGIDLPARHGVSWWLLPLPATYIIGQDGRIVASFFERNFTVISSPRTVIDRLLADR